MPVDPIRARAVPWQLLLADRNAESMFRPPVAAAGADATSTASPDWEQILSELERPEPGVEYPRGNPWTAMEDRINPTLAPAPTGGGAGVERLLALARNATADAPGTPALRPGPPAPSPAPMTPYMPPTPAAGAPDPGAPPAALVRLLAALRAQPGFFERLAGAGIGQRLNARPIVRSGGRGVRELLRGLVGGLEGAGRFQGAQRQQEARAAATEYEGARQAEQDRIEREKADALIARREALTGGGSGGKTKTGQPDMTPFGYTPGMDPLLDAKIDAYKALAERRRRPDAGGTRRGGRGAGGKKKGSAAGRFAADKAYIEAIGNQRKAAGEDPMAVDAWIAGEVARLAEERGQRERGEEPGDFGGVTVRGSSGSTGSSSSAPRRRSTDGNDPAGLR